jgi:hypothetical protein
VVFWDEECRPFWQSVTIPNHPSLFGHTNFLEFAFNTARKARTTTENFVKLSLQQVWNKRPSGMKDKLIRARGVVACKNVREPHPHSNALAGHVVFREIDNFTTRSYAYGYDQCRTRTNAIIRHLLLTVPFGELFFVNRDTSRARRCQA